MAIKYISQNKEKNWKVSNTKTGKAIRVMPTQKEAIAYAATINNTEAIMIKRSSGWKPESSWDKDVADKAIVFEAKNKAKGMSDEEAKTKAAKDAAGSTSSTKKPAVKKTTPKKQAAKKATPKKPAVKKAAPKKPAVKKAAPKKQAVKKAAPKKPAVKKATPKKPAVKKASPKKPAVKKASPKKPAKNIVYSKVEIKKENVKEQKKSTIVEKEFPKNKTSSHENKNNRLTGTQGFILGISIIGIFISVAFLLGYFL